MRVESKREREIKESRINNCVTLYIYMCVRLYVRDSVFLPLKALAERGVGRTVVCVCVRVEESESQGRVGKGVCMSLITTVRVTAGAVCKSSSCIFVEKKSHP